MKSVKGQRAHRVPVLAILLLLTTSAFCEGLTLPASAGSGPQQPKGGAGLAYLYRLSLTSNSDWTTLNFTGGPKVLAYNASVVRGGQAPGFSYVAQPGFIRMNKKAFDNTTVEIQIQLLAITGTADGSASISKGDIGSTNVTLSFYESGAFQPFLSFGSSGINQSSATNTRDFALYYSRLYASPSDSTSLEPVPSGLYHKVFAFYYPWYGNPAGPSGQWSHWVNATQNSIASATDYPLFGAYDSQDPAIIRAQMLLAREAGIDGFISSWWGIGTFEDHSLAVELSVAQQMNFTVSVYYETVRNLTASDMVNELTYVVRQYGSSPAFLKANGRPVIFVYDVNAYGRNATFWLDVREALESNVGPVYLIGGDGEPQWSSYLNVFDGFHSYVMLTPGLMDTTYSLLTTSMNQGLPGLSWDQAFNYVSSGTPLPVEQKDLFFTVTPGMNRTGAYDTGQGPLVIVDRKDGETYEQYWQDAISSNATGVLITSWNEWHEGTELEPSRQYGFGYVDITGIWTAEYKQESSTSVGMPIIQAEVSSPMASRLPGVFDTNLTLSNGGSAPALYTNLTITSGQGLSMGGFVNRNFYTYSETESSNSYSAVIPLIMPDESVTIGISYRLASSEGTISVATRAFNAAGDSAGVAVSHWDLSGANTTTATSSTAASSTTVGSSGTVSVTSTTPPSTSQTTATADTSATPSSTSASSKSTSSAPSTPNGVIQEFSYLPLATAAFAFVLVLSYVAVRRYSRRISNA